MQNANIKINEKTKNTVKGISGTPLTYHRIVVENILRYFSEVLTSGSSYAKHSNIDPLMIPVAHMEYFHDNYGSNPFEFVSKNPGRVMDEYYPGMAASLQNFAKGFIAGLGLGKDISDTLPLEVNKIEVPLKENHWQYYKMISAKKDYGLAASGFKNTLSSSMASSYNLSG